MGKVDERKRAKERKARERQGYVPMPPSMVRSRWERESFLLQAYGKKPANGWESWQLLTGDLVRDGAERGAAETYAKKHDELTAHYLKTLFPEIGDEKYSDWHYQDAWEEVRKVLPNPFRETEDA